MIRRVTARGLNLRSGPDLRSSILRELPRNTAVVATGHPGAWLAVRTFDGEAGWVFGDYTVEDPAPWLSVARQEEQSGVVELPGGKHTARILEYHGTTTLHATTDEVAWCSSFVNWCMLRTGIVGTRLANARSWLSWGRSLTSPVAGCIAVLARGSDDASGHVAFFERQAGDGIWLVGGNQGNRVCEAAFAARRVLSYRWPTAAPLPGETKAAA